MRRLRVRRPSTAVRYSSANCRIADVWHAKGSFAQPQMPQTLVDEVTMVSRLRELHPQPLSEINADAVPSKPPMISP
jgi:hypothetical protein